METKTGCEIAFRPHVEDLHLMTLDVPANKQHAEVQMSHAELGYLHTALGYYLAEIRTEEPLPAFESIKNLKAELEAAKLKILRAEAVLKPRKGMKASDRDEAYRILTGGPSEQMSPADKAKWAEFDEWLDSEN